MAGWCLSSLHYRTVLPLVVAFCLACAVLAFPYAASAYHLEAGGRALDQINESTNQQISK